MLPYLSKLQAFIDRCFLLPLHGSHSNLPSGLIRQDVADSPCILAAGLAMALDVLVSGGGVKLFVSLLLAEFVYLEGLEDASGQSSYKTLPAILGPAVLFETIFYPSGAAIMNGPLIKTHRGRRPLMQGFTETSLLKWTFIRSRWQSVSMYASCHYDKCE